MVELKHETFGAVGTPSIPEDPPKQESKMPATDLRSLIELGCIRDSVTIGDKTFGLRSLNVSERQELANFLGAKPDEKGYLAFNLKVLAMTVETVDNLPFEMYHTDHEKGPMQRRIELLSCLQAPVISRLLVCYNDISERCDKQFNLEEAKN